MQQNIASFSQNLNRDAQKLEQLLASQAVFSDSLTKLLGSLPTKEDLSANVNFDSSGLNRELQSVSGQISELRRAFEAKAGNAASSQQLENLSRTLNDIKVKVDVSNNLKENSAHQLFSKQNCNNKQSNKVC
jgi:hypothetical protein